MKLYLIGHGIYHKCKRMYSATYRRRDDYYYCDYCTPGVRVPSILVTKVTVRLYGTGYPYFISHSNDFSSNYSVRDFEDLIKNVPHTVIEVAQ